jgi:LacI family transcriptional regulator
LRACHKGNYELLIHPCNYRKRTLDAEIGALIEHARPAGIVLAAPLSNMPKIVRAIESTGTPFVRLSPGAKSGEQLTISTNDREISAEMTRYLASLGHKRIAFITGDKKAKAVANRLRGYKDGLRQSGLQFSTELVAAGDNSYGSGVEAAQELLTSKNPPTAIFAANDDMAAATIRVANNLGIAVPAELSVAGFDDISLARQVFPNLTTIRQPLSKMAEYAAETLIQGRSNGDLADEIIVPARLIIRDSTGPAPEPG